MNNLKHLTYKQKRMFTSGEVAKIMNLDINTIETYKYSQKGIQRLKKAGFVKVPISGIGYFIKYGQS